MTIPAFIGHPQAAYGILPPGKHQASVDEIRQRFVDAFPAPGGRQDVFDGWQAFRSLVHAAVAVEIEYLDGSFVTHKPNPKDIDVSYWIQADRINALGPPQQKLLATLFNDRAVQDTFRCDAYVVPICQPGHPQYHDFQFMLWTEHYWSRCRDKTNGILQGIEKGYLEVIP